MIVHPITKLRTPDQKLPHGTNRCKCSGCGEYFGGVRAFELHRVGQYPDRSCLAPSCVSDSQKQPLLRLNDRGYWVHIKKPMISALQEAA